VQLRRLCKSTVAGRDDGSLRRRTAVCADHVQIVNVDVTNVMSKNIMLGISAP